MNRSFNSTQGSALGATLRSAQGVDLQRSFNSTQGSIMAATLASQGMGVGVGAPSPLPSVFAPPGLSAPPTLPPVGMAPQRPREEAAHMQLPSPVGLLPPGSGLGAAPQLPSPLGLGLPPTLPPTLQHGHQAEALGPAPQPLGPDMRLPEPFDERPSSRASNVMSL